MSGYVFTDKLDNKQTYKGSYAVYKGDSSSALYTGKIETSQDSFSFKFPADLADKYATYRIEYHTKMKDANSYETVRNEALIIDFIRTPPTFIRTCADECGNPIP